MEPKLAESLDILYKENKLNKPIVLWGIGAQTKELIEKLHKFGSSVNICMIVDNFKYTFLKEYTGIPVREPKSLSTMEKDQVTVLLAVNWADAIWKQLSAYGISEVFNLYNLEERLPERECNLPYHFIDRKRNRKTLCYILAGYEPLLWNNTLARVEAFQSDEVDYCLVSSGKYEKYLDELAEKNHWSYLYTKQNQVCYIQNLVIELHPQAEYIIKMDEDIFVGKGFFGRMLQEFRRIEKEGDHRIGFAVPVIPLNCCGYVSYLQAIGKKEEFEQRFGRAYKSRFSAVFTLEDTAEYLWDTLDSFDSMADLFLQREGNSIGDCYFNIGCIMFTRERWLMMGKWPEKQGESGMGADERHICKDNTEKDMSVYEVQSVLAGHLAFGHQKQKMMKYYKEHYDKFKIYIG